MNTEVLIVHAKTILENAELMNHAIGKNSTPGPLVYDLTGYAGATAGELVKLTQLLANGLLLSMAEHQVHDENGRPATATNAAIFGLGEAAAHAHKLAAALGRVQATVNGLTYTDREPEPRPPSVPISRCMLCGGRLGYWGDVWWSVTSGGNATLEQMCGASDDGKHVPSPEDKGAQA